MIRARAGKPTLERGVGVRRRECPLSAELRRRCAEVGKREPFLDRTGAGGASREAVRVRRGNYLEINPAAEPISCSSKSGNRNHFNGVVNSERSLGNSKSGKVVRVRKWHMGCHKGWHCGIGFVKDGGNRHSEIFVDAMYPG